jgi:uncharacterized protein (DUF2147 family)
MTQPWLILSVTGPRPARVKTIEARITKNIKGLVFISGCTKKSVTLWENGTVYDPTSGKSYSCLMELQGPDKIKLRGVFGTANLILPEPRVNPSR